MKKVIIIYSLLLSALCNHIHADIREVSTSEELVSAVGTAEVDEIHIKTDITLNQTVEIDRQITIQSSDGNKYSLTAAAGFRMFNISAPTVELKNLIFKGVNTSVGGAIYSTGNVIIENCEFTGNILDKTLTSNEKIEGFIIRVEKDLTMIRSIMTGNKLSVIFQSGIGNIYDLNGALINAKNIYFQDFTMSDNTINLDSRIDIISFNEMAQNGGMIFANDKLSLKGNSVITNNSLNIEAGKKDYAINGVFFYASDIEMTGKSVFSSNKCSYSTERHRIFLLGSLYANKKIRIDGSCKEDHLFDGNGMIPLDESNHENYSTYTKGGAIYLNNAVTGDESVIKGATFKNGQAYKGGAIYMNEKTRLVLSDVNFESNKTQWEGESLESLGGAVYADGGSVLSVDNSRFVKNRSYDAGGAIYSFGKVSITKSSFGDKDDTASGNVANYAGAVYVYTYDIEDENEPHLVVDECLFYHNQYKEEKGNASRGGGALYFTTNMESSRVKISNSFFEGNKAVSGGAMAISGSPWTKIDVLCDKVEFISNSSVTGNNEKRDGNGGAVLERSRMGEGIFLFKDCLFKGNYSSRNGGAYYGSSSGGDYKVAFEGCDFNENESVITGGAITFIYDDLETDVRMSGCTFSKNKTGTTGGAIANIGSFVSIYNSLIKNNDASNEGLGGGIYLEGKGLMWLTNSLITGNQAFQGGGILNNSTGQQSLIGTNITVANNVAVSEGQDILDAWSNIMLRNSIVWNKAKPDDSLVDYKVGYNTPTFEYSLISGYPQSDPHNLPGDTDPLFDSDYKLSNGSPLINAGNKAYFEKNMTPDLSSITKDFAGNGRVYGKGIDLGAYESAYDPVPGPRAGFVADGTPVCEGSSGTLQVKIEGGTAPWKLSYRQESATIPLERTINDSDLDNGVYMLTGLTVGSSSTKYVITSIKSQDGTEGSVTNAEAVIPVLSKPSVSAISGASEVYVNESITLSNPTTGGYWYSQDTEYATVSQNGTVSGIKEGSVDIWYTVTGPAPTHCETIVTHTVVIKTKGSDPDPGPDPEPGPDPDPDPDPDPWPPVIPDPEPNPDPNPNAWIIVRPIAPICYLDDNFNIGFNLLYTDKPLMYAIAFTESSKGAGFEDVKTYKELPEEGFISSVKVPSGIAAGTYSGYIILREKGSEEMDLYPFHIIINKPLEIIRQPESVVGQPSGNRFTLSVEAEGDDIAYQWFFNGNKIEGAVSDKFTDVISTENEGTYYVEVTGSCGYMASDEVTVSSCFTFLIKWTDVLYVQNTDNRYVRFQWYKNGQPLTTHGTSIYYTDPAGLSGLYSVRAYKADGSYDESCTIEFTGSGKESSVMVYPTVVHQNSTINIETKGINESYKNALIELFSLTGNKVFSTRMLIPQTQIRVNQPPGIYLIRVTSTDGRNTVEKIMIK